jgi:hypothetical protein
MSDIQIFGLGLAALIGIGIFIAILALGYGALCLHLATIKLNFKKRSLRKAFAANTLIVLTPPIGSVGAHILADYAKNCPPPAWPYIAGAVILGVIGGLLPILAVKHIYKQTFSKSLMACIVAGLIEMAIAIALFIGLATALIAMGIMKSNAGG